MKAFKRIISGLLIMTLLLGVCACGNTGDSHISKEVQVGDCITFGTYEQDNNTTNGKEAILWRVLEVNDGKALVISEYALDCKVHNNTKDTPVTWETCSLRQWLNNEFLNTAFSADEKSRIPAVTVPADKNPSHDTDPGNATQDKVFLLSITEANRYFGSNSERACKPTMYATAKGAFVSSTDGNCKWCLRSPGLNQYFAAYVNSSGVILEFGYFIYVDSEAIRPALWINLD